MKIYDHLQPDNISSLFLYGVIMLANIDYVSIADYAIKALVGGLVWFSFSLLQNYYSVKVKKIARERIEKKELEEEEKK